MASRVQNIEVCDIRRSIEEKCMFGRHAGRHRSRKGLERHWIESNQLNRGLSVASRYKGSSVTKQRCQYQTDEITMV